jgi:ABC-type transporter Mla subunit MlaD
VLTTLQNNSSNLAATLQELPPTMSSIDSSFSAVRGVLPRVDRAVQSLYPVAAELPGSLTALRRLSGAANPALEALLNPVQRLVPLAKGLVPLSENLNSALSSLLPQVGTFNHATDDLVRCKIGVQGFFQWDASMSKLGDARGAVPRGNVVFGTGNLPNEGFQQACTPGTPIGPALPTPASEH